MKEGSHVVVYKSDHSGVAQQVLINGTEVKLVTRVDVSAYPGQPVSMTLEFIPGNVEYVNTLVGHEEPKRDFQVFKG